MHLFGLTSGAVSLTLLSLSSYVHAQSNIVNENVTIRFFPEGQGDSCDYHNSDSALTFTTSSVTNGLQCFNLARLFGGNATQGFEDQTAKGTGEVGVAWQLLNAESFDAKANYSRVLYRQHIANAQEDKYKPGHPAKRQVTVYSGKDCSDLDETTRNGTQPWYGFSCWSEDQGSCGTLPYGVVSFAVKGTTEKDAESGKCWSFAKSGQESAGTHIRAPLQAAMGLIVGASVAMWLAV